MVDSPAIGRLIERLTNAFGTEQVTKRSKSKTTKKRVHKVGQRTAAESIKPRAPGEIGALNHRDRKQKANSPGEERGVGGSFAWPVMSVDQLGSWSKAHSRPEQEATEASDGRKEENSFLVVLASPRLSAHYQLFRYPVRDLE